MEKSVTQAESKAPVIAQRFRGFLPVVVDVETAGFNAQTDALLEIACIPIVYDEQGQFIPGPSFHAHINPFEGANLDRRSLDFIGIDPFNPMRVAMAEDERGALKRIFKSLNEVRKAQHCT
ncbi:MAG: ribonuclease T, partial [Acinetobacter sp.]|nr:ribonuclease T [Acinetobacter sp.]